MTPELWRTTCARIESTATSIHSVDRDARYVPDTAELITECERLRRENWQLNQQLTHVQTRCTELLEDSRAVRPLLARLARARELHPEGCNLAALVSEVGEVATAMLRETQERARDELLDVATVAMRLAAGETCAS